MMFSERNIWKREATSLFSAASITQPLTFIHSDPCRKKIQLSGFIFILRVTNAPFLQQSFRALGLLLLDWIKEAEGISGNDCKSRNRLPKDHGSSNTIYITVSTLLQTISVINQPVPGRGRHWKRQLELKILYAEIQLFQTEKHWMMESHWSKNPCRKI